MRVQQSSLRRNGSGIFEKARFRLKKKERNSNLEQQISELSGRAEDLEKEAEDLRRENGWLKEIVIMKSHAQRGRSEVNQAETVVVSEEEGDGEEERPVRKQKQKQTQKQKKQTL